MKGDLSLHAAAQGDQPVVIPAQELFIRPGLVIKPLELGQTDQLSGG